MSLSPPAEERSPTFLFLFSFLFFFGDPSSVVASFLRSLVRGRFALLFSRMGDRCPVSRPPDGEEEKRENQDILHMLEQWLGNRRWKAEGEVFMADGENSSLPLIDPCRRGLFDSNARSVHFGRAITTVQLSLPRWAMEATDCRWRRRP